MKRLMVLACMVGLAAAGCDEKLNPSSPSSSTVTFTAQMAAALEVPAAVGDETAAVGRVTITMTPAAGGAYVADFAFQAGGFSPTTAIFAGHIHNGLAGAAGPVVAPLPISAAAPVLTPTRTMLLTFSGVTIPAAVAAGMIATPAAYYVNLHSAVNPGGVIRGNLTKQ